MKKSGMTGTVKSAGFKTTPKIYTSIEQVRQALIKRGEIKQKTNE